MVGLLLIRALTGWKKWADRNFTKLKHKCQVLHLQWNIPMQPYRLEANWLRNSSAESKQKTKETQHLAPGTAAEDAETNECIATANTAIPFPMAAHRPQSVTVTKVIQEAQEGQTLQLYTPEYTETARARALRTSGGSGCITQKQSFCRVTKDEQQDSVPETPLQKYSQYAPEDAVLPPSGLSHMHNHHENKAYKNKYKLKPGIK
ncbi:hypothetical protein QYF61_013415 [Mycteria americana]|uniref:Uncharacterized protein n=1 Tax=Mycteria americana TaxID=33587 RepID=A0AAN7RXU2_MYCAM|nr:hypothetical protein QYF61_013415 [Mycteria americana]